MKTRKNKSNSEVGDTVFLKSNPLVLGIRFKINTPYVAIEFLSTQTCRIVPMAKSKVVNVAELINGSHLRARISKFEHEIRYV